MWILRLSLARLRELDRDANHRLARDGRKRSAASGGVKPDTPVERVCGRENVGQRHRRDGIA